MIHEYSPSARHGGFVDTQTHIAALVRERDDARKESGMWKRLYEKASSDLKRLKAYLSWENRLFAVPSSKMSDAQKIVARVLPSVVSEAKARTNTDDARDDGMLRVYMKEIAASTGKSEDSIGKTLKEMHARGTAKRDLKSMYNKKSKGNENAIFLDVTPELMSLQLPAAPPRNTGNNQKNHVICKSCGTELVQVKKVIQGVCPSCGTVHVYDLSRKEDRAFVVDANTAQNWQEWYDDLPGGDMPHSSTYEMEHDVDTQPSIPAQPPAKKQRVLCGHDRRYWYTNQDGSPGCELCDAPWGGKP